MTPDWTNDAEYRKLRAELIASFGERRKALAAAISKPSAPVTNVVREVAHKLAGAAGSYGLPVLGRAAEAVDDLLGAEEFPSASDVVGHARLLSDLLLEAERVGDDPVFLSGDARLRRLISAAQARGSD